MTTQDSCGCRGCAQKISAGERISWIEGAGPYHVHCSPSHEDRSHADREDSDLAARESARYSMSLYDLSRSRFGWLYRIEHIKNPTIVKWFGSEVTRFRATICGIAALLNSHLLLARDIPAIQIKTIWDFLLHVAGYFLFYIGFIGITSILTLYLIGTVVAIFFEHKLPWKSTRYSEDYLLREALGKP